MSVNAIQAIYPNDAISENEIFGTGSVFGSSTGDSQCQNFERVKPKVVDNTLDTQAIERSTYSDDTTYSSSIDNGRPWAGNACTYRINSLTEEVTNWTNTASGCIYTRELTNQVEQPVTIVTDACANSAPSITQSLI